MRLIGTECATTMQARALHRQARHNSEGNQRRRGSARQKDAKSKPPGRCEERTSPSLALNGYGASSLPTCVQRDAGVSGAMQGFV